VNGQATIKLNTGAEMPALALGTWRLSGTGREQAVGWALEAGYRHVDTAAMYGNEQFVGAGLRVSGVPRDAVFVTTKLAGWDHVRPREAALESLDRLGLEHVDCYLIHWPGGSGADLDVWPVLEELHTERRLKAIGVSNYPVPLVQELLDSADVPPAVNQVEMNPFTHPRDIVAACHDSAIAVQAYSPLGKASRLDDPRVREVAERLGRTPAQVVLRWGIQHGVAVLPKSGDRERIEANGRLFDFELGGDDMASLDSLG